MFHCRFPFFIFFLSFLLNYPSLHSQASQLSDEDMANMQKAPEVQANTARKIQRQSYYPDGKLKNIQTWTYDENGKGIEHGPTAEFYPDGKLKQRGNIVQGKKSGKWVFIGPNNDITQGEYQNDKRSGNWKVWSKDKQLLINENYFNEDLHGPRQTYYDTGTQASEEFFVKGKKQGLFKTWYANGKLSNEISYFNDAQHGEAKTWDTTGVLLVKGSFYIGIPDGKWSWYDLEGELIQDSYFENGTGNLYEFIKAREKNTQGDIIVKIALKRKIPFQDGKIHGQQESYYPNGNLESQVSFNQGTQSGPFEEYYLNKTLRAKGEFFNGKPTGTLNTYHQGLPESEEDPIISKTVVYDNTQENAVLTEFSQEGKKTLAMELNNETPHGMFQTFYANGQIMTMGEFQYGERNGTWKEYYSNGNLHLTQEYFVDEKHGPVHEWYNLQEGQKDAQKKLEGNYFQGKKEGKWMEWYPNGSVASNKAFRYGLEDGEHLEYWPEKDPLNQNMEELRQRAKYRRNKKELAKRRLKSKGTFILGKREGEWKTWYPNGLLRSSMSFKGGQQDGTAYEWFDYLVDSKNILKLQGEYQNGQQNGLWQSFYKGGEIETKQNFKSGVLHGSVKYFYETGEIKLASEFKQGKQHGQQIEYFPNGKKKSENTYIDGHPHGDYTLYYSNENMAVKGKYNRGLSVGHWEWYDQTGKNLIKTSSFANGTGTMYEYYPTGELKSESKLKDGLKQGKESLYYISGHLQAQANYKNNLLNGEYKEYHEDGNILAKTSWIYGKRNGLYEYWFGNQQKQFQLSFVDDRIHGPYQEWYENGNRRSEGQWIQGLKHGSWVWYDRYGSKTLQQVFDAGVVISSEKFSEDEKAQGLNSEEN